ncbi:hypothetical protein GSF08_03470 [Clostridiaceae bacterium DONG20-135]|uniref:Lipopolysaccharide biosynthesis protein n=1 Tax=Copranaerobaculum intestinale TaxID=2692629 RepID=A0A6N8U6R7_9FIRM|nr:hypothetical protein [Copranaerobaculum intestinale]MXQ72994.1 hypothetical protein [Copranaerobaculum intestinale]
MKSHPTDKEIYFWNITGSFLNALLSVMLLLFVNRILGVKNGDIFSVGFAIAQLMLTVGTYQVRLYQATDIRSKYTFNVYFWFRLFTLFMMIVVSLIYIFLRNYDSYTYFIILSLCIFRAGDAFSDVYQGLYQQKDRLDLSGKSIAFKVMASMTTFVLSMIFFKNLLVSCLTLMMTEWIMVYLYDIRTYRTFKKKYEIEEIKKVPPYKEMKELFLICTPLFLNVFLINDIFNTPKFQIDTYISNGTMTAGSQTYYSIIFMIAFVMNLIVFVFRPILTQLSSLFYHRQLKEILKKISMILLVIIASTLACMIGAYFIGIPVLSILYGTGDGLLPYRDALLIIIVAGGINAFSTFLDNVITIFRKHYFLLLCYMGSWLTMKSIAPGLVAKFGVNGAALSFLITMLTQFILILSLFMILFYRIWRKKHDKQL